jgi:protein-disulfide isomerase
MVCLSSSTDARNLRLSEKIRMDLAHQANLQDHTLGPLTAKVVLVEYADYQCPLSGRAHLIVKDVVGWYRNLVCFVYRHFPHRYKHPLSHLAALAAEAAAVQGCFWEMHNYLFANQQLLNRNHLIRYATDLRMDVGRFMADLDSAVGAAIIEQHVASANKSGVLSGPAFFLNGAIQKDWNRDELIEAISLAVNEDGGIPI